MNRNKSKAPARALLLFIFVSVLASCTRQPAYPPAPQNGPNIVIDASRLEPEIPVFYTYLYHGKSISYFVVKIQDKIQSYLDACASCYPHKRGYHYKNGAVTCRFCGQKFSVNKLDKGLGGCYPIKIEGRMVKGQYLIPVVVLEKESDKF